MYKMNEDKSLSEQIEDHEEVRAITQPLINEYNDLKAEHTKMLETLRNAESGLKTIMDDNIIEDPDSLIDAVRCLRDNYSDIQSLLTEIKGE
jgi:hypothetical protein